VGGSCENSETSRGGEEGRAPAEGARGTPGRRRGVMELGPPHRGELVERGCAEGTPSATGGCPLLGLELVGGRAELSMAPCPSASLGPVLVLLPAPRWPKCPGLTPCPRPEGGQQVTPGTVTAQG